MTESELLRALNEKQVWMGCGDVLLALQLDNVAWNSTVSNLHALAKAEVIQRHRTPKGAWEFGALGVLDAGAPDRPRVASDLPSQYVERPVWAPGDGDFEGVWNRRGPYTEQPPPVGYRCCWAIKWLLEPYPTPAVEDMERGALLLEAADATAQGRFPATLLLQAGEGGHVKEVQDTLRAARPHYVEAVGLWGLSNPQAALLHAVVRAPGWDISLPDGLSYRRKRAGGWFIMNHENHVIHDLCGAPPPRSISQAEERAASAAVREAMARTWRRR